MHIQIDTSSTACWQKLIHEAQDKSNYTITEDLESYLIFMLIRLTKDIDIANTVLAIDYLESQTRSGAMKQEQLRDVGDRCLLFGGFYPEQAHKKLVSLDYFVELGKGAYIQIANSNNISNHFSGLNKLFTELANNFIVLLDILHNIKLLDHTKEWMLDEITKYEKNKLETSMHDNVIFINTNNIH